MALVRILRDLAFCLALTLLGPTSSLAQDAWGRKVQDRDFTVEEIKRGRDYFQGKQALQNGGPACAVCHTLGDGALPGGGRPGGDLLRLFRDKNKVFDFPTVAGWLKHPTGIPAMEQIFRNHPLEPPEIELLAAFLKEELARGGRLSLSTPAFFLLGLGSVVGAWGLYTVIRKRHSHKDEG